MGLWALFTVITTIVEQVKMGLLRNAMVKFIHRPDFVNHRSEIQSASLMINMVFTAVVILLVLITGKFIAVKLQSPGLFPLLLLSIPSYLLLVLYNHCEIVQQAHMQYPPIFKATVIRQGVFFLGVVLLFFFFKPYFTLVTLILVQIFALVLGTIYFQRASRQYLSLKFVYNKEITMQLLHFGKFVFGTSLFSNLSRFLDHFITSAVSNPIPGMGSVYVSYYNAVSRLTNMIDVPSIAAADVLFPKNAQASGTEGQEKVKYYFERMVGTLLALVVPISLFVFIFPGFVISIIAGKAYMDAVPILQVTILANIVRPIFTQFGTTLDAIGKPKLNFIVNTIIMLVNMVAIYVCIKFSNGKMGAAYGTVISSVFTFFIVYLSLRKTLNIELKNIIAYFRLAYVELFKGIKKIMQGNNATA